MKLEPFSTGSEYMDWFMNNCAMCKKCFDAATTTTLCEIEQALALGSVTDGTLLCDGAHTEEHAISLAKRLNWDGEGDLPAKCPEFEQKEGAA